MEQESKTLVVGKTTGGTLDDSVPANRRELAEKLKAARLQHELRSSVTSAQFAFDLLRKELRSSCEVNDNGERYLSYLEKSLDKAKQIVLPLTSLDDFELQHPSDQSPPPTS